MPHPYDHPAVARAITRSLPNQLAKAKQTGDTATAQAIEAALARARRIVAPPPASPGPPRSFSARADCRTKKPAGKRGRMGGSRCR
jgi:hypothetical protein